MLYFSNINYQSDLMENSVLIGRQPILDSQSNIFAYELLFRSRLESNDLDERQITSQVACNALLSIGLDELIGDKLAFINIDREFLLNPALESIPKDRFVFEVLETVVIDDIVLERIKALHSQGFVFALDDFEFTTEQIKNFECIFPYISILKIDVLACDICQSSQMLRKHFKTFESYGMELLAEKIEDLEAFDAYKELGCGYFQGFYFSKPTIIEGQKIDPSRSAIIGVIKLLVANEPIEVIQNALAKSPEISINLIKLLNSATFGLKREITSIKQAITLMGMQPLLKWVTLLLYAFPDSHNVNMKSLMESVLLRAELMKQLVLAHGDKVLAETAYFTGLISMLDTILHRPIKEVLEDMNFGENINSAILEHAQMLGNVLELAKNLEQANPKKDICASNALKLDYETMTKVLFTAYANVIKLEEELSS